MALFTKEQSVGALIVLPFIWMLRRYSSKDLAWRDVLRYGIGAGLGFAAVAVVGGNLWWNPSGFVNRWRFLLGTLPPEILEKYAPYRIPVAPPTSFSVSSEIAWLARVIRSVITALTQPGLLICLVGTAVALWRWPRQAAVPLLVILSYYIFSLRAMAEMPVRRTMPLYYFLLIFGGVAGGVVLDRIRHISHATPRRLAMGFLLVLLGLALLPGVEIDRLLVNDQRYAAEHWMRINIPTEARVEVYQLDEYLPRFPRGMKVERIPLEQRTISSFQQRQPDFVVMSSDGGGRLARARVLNWQPGEEMWTSSPPAKEFFDQLLAEQLGYRRVSQFPALATWLNPSLGSVNPGIIIWARPPKTD
jgi:hypothetical protein